MNNIDFVKSIKYIEINPGEIKILGLCKAKDFKKRD
jgi:hypothetical protein